MRDRDRAVPSARCAEYEALLDRALAVLGARLEAIRLPLHILLEAHFGELNENQVELLADARDAALAAEGELGKIRRILELGRGAAAFHPEPLRLVDLFESVLPAVQARAAPAGVVVTADVSPMLPYVRGDRAHLREALDLLLSEAVSRSPGGGRVGITAASEGESVRLVVEHGGADGNELVLLLLERLIAAQGGVCRDLEGRFVVELPAAWAVNRQAR